MLWKTILLSSVNLVTVLMVIIPVATVQTSGFEEEIFVHSGPAYFFFIQIALGIFAVIIDVLNKRPHLQTKLLTAGVVLSGTFAGIILWYAHTFDHVGLYINTSAATFGAWLPMVSVACFLIVWIDQRRRTTPNKKAGKN